MARRIVALAIPAVSRKIEPRERLEDIRLVFGLRPLFVRIFYAQHERTIGMFCEKIGEDSSAIITGM